MKELKSLMTALGLVIATAAGSMIQAQERIDQPMLPLTNSSSAKYVGGQPLTFAQQTARFEAEQRTMRLEWNKWIGHSPLRPAMNADLFMGDNSQRYYLPNRGIIVGNYRSTSWYW